jgi:hypothetical protein
MVQAALNPQAGKNFPDFNSVRMAQKVVEAREVVGTLNNKEREVVGTLNRKRESISCRHASPAAAAVAAPVAAAPAESAPAESASGCRCETRR